MGLEPQWKQRCQKREFSSGSMAAENPMIGNVFSVQQLLSILPAMGCFQNVHTQLLLGRLGRAGQQWTCLPATVKRVLAAQQSLLLWPCEAWLSCFCLCFWLCNYFVSCVAVKAALACAESVIKYDPPHIVPTVHHALCKTLSSWHFFTFTCFSETSVSFPWLQGVQQ